MSLDSLFQKYGCSSPSDLTEAIADAAFEEAKLFKSRLNVRPLRLKHVKKMQALAAEESLVINIDLMQVESRWKVESSWIEQLRQFETQVAMRLTQLFQADSAAVMCSFALALHEYLVSFETHVVQSVEQDYPFEVKSQDEFSSSTLIQLFSQNRVEEAQVLLAKERKRLLLFV
jgi:hypothetical protein